MTAEIEEQHFCDHVRLQVFFSYPVAYYLVFLITRSVGFTPSYPSATATCVPYAQASPLQVSLALLFLQQELRLHFPTLQWLTWVDALLAFQPDLWVADTRVFLDYEDLTHLAQYLAASPELPQLEPLIHGPRAGYLAKRLVSYQDRAIAALGDLEASPQVYGYRVHALVTELALGNSVADEVFHATQWGRRGKRQHPDRAAARETAQDRVLALQCARRESSAPALASPVKVKTATADQ